ncbi:nitrous oxide reductase accessory protein NosL [Flavobacterium oreochromis]|uniref:nitrous oxide reductase accessory protein NosL n=2 Tax=Flavobacterium oreochromis TaxID=2906078 RepID=UPI000B4CC635|nr:nitrous oxide reductase accessory protein NosL [Flavobacterium oreochromis]
MLNYKFLLLFSFALFLSCGSDKPQPIKLNIDQCESCKMTISNPQFSSEIITEKGRCYKFDDIFCLLQYINNTKVKVKTIYVSDYSNKNMIPIEEGFFLKHEQFNSPMNGNIACFSDLKETKKYQTELHTDVLNWKQLTQIYK